MTFRRITVFRLGLRDDTFLGGAGRQVVYGLLGDDRLYGRAGRDRLVGGPGTDQAYGGRGRDSCRAEISSGCERR